VKPFKESENFTMVHNYLFDSVMPKLKPNAWKVLCCILRNTAGWKGDNGRRKLTDKLSYSQLREKTGIASDGTLNTAIEQLVKAKYIRCRPGLKWQATTYGINWDYEAPTTEIVVEQESSTTEIVVEPTTEIVAVSTTEIVDTKEKERKGKKTDSANGTRATSPHQEIIDAYVKELAYTPSNMGREAKAAKWLTDNHYSPAQVVACYRHMKRDRFWSDKFLSLQKISEQIAEFAQRNTPAGRETRWNPITKTKEEKVGGQWYTVHKATQDINA
jgi:hypothetical protein